MKRQNQFWKTVPFRIFLVLMVLTYYFFKMLRIFTLIFTGFFVWYRWCQINGVNAMVTWKWLYSNGCNFGGLQTYLTKITNDIPGGGLGRPTDRDQWNWVFLNDPKKYFATDRIPKKKYFSNSKTLKNTLLRHDSFGKSEAWYDNNEEPCLLN